jgi:hypothetical protein
LENSIPSSECKAEILIFKNMIRAGHQWLTSVILATQKAEIGRITRFEASPDKQFMRPYLKNAQHKKGLAECLK